MSVSEMRNLLDASGGIICIKQEITAELKEIVENAPNESKTIPF